jgi:formylglycine-generating enzyme required for sulfatase activity
MDKTVLKRRTGLFFTGFVLLYTAVLCLIYQVNWDDIYFFSSRPIESKKRPHPAVGKTTAPKQKAISKLQQRLNRIKVENQQGKERKMRLLKEFAQLDRRRWLIHQPALYRTTEQFVGEVSKMTLTELRQNRSRILGLSLKLSMMNRKVSKLPLSDNSTDDQAAKVIEQPQSEQTAAGLQPKINQPELMREKPELKRQVEEPAPLNSAELELISKFNSQSTLNALKSKQPPARKLVQKKARDAYEKLKTIKLYESEPFSRQYTYTHKTCVKAKDASVSEQDKKEFENIINHLEKLKAKAGVIALNLIGLEPIPQELSQEDKRNPHKMSQYRAAAESGFPLEVKNRYGMHFRFIPAGTFMMGSPETEKGRSKDEKLHKVIISAPFYIQTTEISSRQLRFLKDKPGHLAANKVSWKKAVEYCRKLNIKENLPREAYQLPTEAMWEYACRAGTQTPAYHSELGKIAHFGNSFSGSVQNSQQLLPNNWGLFDTLGNVNELCLDRQDDSFFFTKIPKTYVDNIKDPVSDKGSSIVIRGGGWGSSRKQTRAAYRKLVHPESSEWDIGLRLIRRIYLKWEN